MPALRSLLVAVVLGVAAQPAAAADPISIGSGHLPDTALDSAGDALVAWNALDDANNRSALMFCRVPRGGAACDGGARELTVPGTSLTPPWIFVSGSRV